MKKRNWLFWTPRILAIVFIVFISIFAIDVFWEGYSFWVTLGALFMHLLPSLVLIGALVVAWKWEKIGGIIFIALSLVFTIFFNTYRDPRSLLITAPVLVIGILFLLSYFRKKRKKHK